MIHNEFKIELTKKGVKYQAYLAPTPRLSCLLSCLKLLLKDCGYTEEDILKAFKEQLNK